MAVVGFTNVTGNAEDDWLGTGIAETVGTDLKTLCGLAVIGRERVHEILRKRRADRTDVSDPIAFEVGHEVGARWIVTGGYQRVGGQIRITARFAEVATGEVLHTVKADGTLEKLFELQDHLARELSRGIPVTRPGPAPMEGEETTVLAAYRAYSNGLWNLRAAGRDSLERAILLFEKAAALDPNYLRAQVALASAYEDKGTFLVMPELIQRSVEILQRVLARNPNLADAWKGLAQSLMQLEREDEALLAIERAVALAPEESAHWAAKGRVLFVGKARFAEAAEVLEKALALNPQAGWAALQLAQCHAFLGNLARAEAVARRAVDLQETLQSGKDGFLIVGAHVRLGHALALGGRLPEAEAAFWSELAFLTGADHALRPRLLIELNARLGSVLLAQGRNDEGRAHLHEAVTRFADRVRDGADEPFSRYYVTLSLALLGEKDKAFEFLSEAARRRRAFTLERARLDPDLESLRSDPRWKELVG